MTPALVAHTHTHTHTLISLGHKKIRKLYDENGSRLWQNVRYFNVFLIGFRCRKHFELGDFYPYLGWLQYLSYPVIHTGTLYNGIPFFP
jgi:hypothetical protein